MVARILTSVHLTPSILWLRAILTLAVLALTSCSAPPTAPAPSAKASPSAASEPTPALSPELQPPEAAFAGWIAFVADLGGGYDLYLIDPVTFDLRAFGLVGLPPGYPAWSPDWAQISFLGPYGDVYLLDVSCLDRGDCRESLSRYKQDDRVLFTVSWLPNEEAVIFATDPSQDRQLPQVKALSLSDGTTSVVLMEGGPNPRVAPNATSMLFDSYIGPDQLMLFDIDTGSITPLMEKSTRIPNSSSGDWSPDGTQVAFMTTLGEGMGYGVRYEIVVAQADGTEARIVAEDGLHPDWSPDGSQIVFEREDGLYVINLATGDERKITDLPHLHGPPMAAWSP